MRGSGEVRGFEPNRIGRGMGYPNIYYENDQQLGNEYGKERLDRARYFQERLAEEGRLNASDSGIAKGAAGMELDGDWKDYHTIINAPGDTLRFKQY